MRSRGTPAEPQSVGCTCLRLRKASRRVSQIYDRALEPCGLTVTQYGLLGHIAALDGIGIGALAAKMVMDPTTLTRNLKPLLGQALVVLAPDPADRRARRLKLTDDGRRRLARAKPAWKSAQLYLEQVLGKSDAPALNAVLDRALARLADASGPAPRSAP
ncbi:MAG TPA: MarR family winged helix-turn-helix transcriptional regulator [Hyphomicrobiaceae bacterium]|jgi:DNA-binding MarR family transcriptional regulator|nr:MarR family winged helix-turn-helix transcriptional regulator [Hyphomicrobiaceae bacterium]